MIVLDASVLIAYFEPADGHHSRAVQLLLDADTELLGINPITLAETLVGPARAGRLDTARQILADLELVTLTLPVDAAWQLAELRAKTGLRLPDCCVLLSAAAEGAVASFDRRLTDAAAALGQTVLGP